MTAPKVVTRISLSALTEHTGCLWSFTYSSGMCRLIRPLPSNPIVQLFLPVMRFPGTWSSQDVSENDRNSSQMSFVGQQHGSNADRGDGTSGQAGIITPARKALT